MDFKTIWGDSKVPEQNKEFTPFVEGKYNAELEEVSLDKTVDPAKLTFVFRVRPLI